MFNIVSLDGVNVKLSPSVVSAASITWLPVASTFPRSEISSDGQFVRMFSNHPNPGDIFYYTKILYDKLIGNDKSLVSKEYALRIK